MVDLGWRLIEAFLYLVAIILGLIGLTFPYLLCCGPGIAMLWITYRWRNETTLGRTLAVAAVHAIFFAPAAILLAHNMFIVPVFVGAIAYWFIDGIGRMWWLAASSGAVLVGSIILQLVRSNFRLQRTPASGRR